MYNKLGITVLIHFLSKIGILFLVVYLFFGIILFKFQHNLIYHPDITAFDTCAKLVNSQKITYGSTRAYLTNRSEHKLIVFYHGNAGRACDRAYLESFFGESNYSTLFVEYTGFSEENGTPTKEAILRNVSDTVDYLSTQKFEKILVFGESIGAGPAAYHSSMSQVSKLILITPYNNLADVAFYHYPIYPMSLLLRENYTPDKWLENYKSDVTLILAENDEVMIGNVGEKLFQSLSSNIIKSLIKIPNTGHNSIYESGTFYDHLRKEL